MKFDHLHSGLNPSVALAPAVGTDDTVLTTNTLDLAGSIAAELYIILGTLADAGATWTVVMYEGDASNMSDEVAVADADLVGLEADASFTQASDNLVRKIGYVGSKLYIRAKITPSGNASNAPVAGMWLTKKNRASAAANPPA